MFAGSLDTLHTRWRQKAELFRQHGHEATARAYELCSGELEAALGAKEGELLDLGLISRDEVANQTVDKPAYKKYFMHGTSHHLGLDVHDLCLRYEPFRAGMVFTCEPGIYIPEEKLGIRLENNIVITDDGPVDLFASIPIEADEIEELMNAGVLS